MEKTLRITLLSLFLAASSAVVLAKNHASDVFSLKIWKLTIPIDDGGDGKPDEIPTEELRYFEDPDFFFLSKTKDSIVFRARCGAPTTENSKYPRCELREMKPGGRERASWGSNDGMIHNMTFEAAFNRTTAEKAHAVCAQIHGGDDDLMMVRLEGSKLFIERNDLEPVYLTREYELGTFFKVMIIVDNGRVRAFYEGDLVMEWPVDRDGLYFKAGVYTQSNAEKGEDPDDFAEVEFRSLFVTHKKE